MPQAPPGAEPLERRRERIEARIDAQLQDTLAADRARVLPDTYWSHLGARLEDGFRPGWSLLDRGSPDDAVLTGTRAGQALSAWQRSAAEWGRTGRAADPDAAARPGSPRSPGAPELMPEEAARTLLATELVTRIEIVQDAGGRITSVRVVEPSGNAAHDALAVSHVRGRAGAAGASLGPPPDQGRRTWWAVRTRFSIFPPVPVAGCSFDATFHPAGCFYPLKRTVKTRFQLERVWRGG